MSDALDQARRLMLRLLLENPALLPAAADSAAPDDARIMANHNAKG